MNEQRAALMMEGRIVPSVRPLRPREVCFVDANRPGVVFVGLPADERRLQEEGSATHRIPWKSAQAYLRGGLEEAQRTGDPSFLWDWEDLVPAEKKAKQ